MKFICAVPSISMVSIVICRYYSLSSSSLLMIKLKRHLLLALHHMTVTRNYCIKFRFYCFVFNLVVRNDMYYVYQLKSSRSYKDCFVFNEKLF